MQRNELEQINMFKEENMTDIKKCSCVHEVQDELHGKNNRVHNECTEGWRCTVCSKVTSVDRDA